MHRYANTLLRLLASRTFFILCVVLLVAQATWVALSFRYPMLWDEYYHFGLIQYYGHHLNPIISHQPSSLDVYGNVERSPKYLYHFLMSFPYRLIALITPNQVAQVIVLRMFNIALFSAGLVAFQRAMLLLTKSRALVNFTLLVLVLLPLSSLLAAQINYDNLEFLLAGLMFYWTFRLLQAEKLQIRWLILVTGVGLLATVVKYTFAPILLGMLVVLTVHFWRRNRWAIFGDALDSFKRQSTQSAIGLSLLLVLALGLSVERFGVNVVKYHALDPKCSAVLGVDRCLAFSPFKQEHTYALEKDRTQAPPPHGLVGYTFMEWCRQLYDQYFTTGTQLAYEEFEVSPVFKIPYFSFLAAGVFGGVCFVLRVRRFIKPEFMVVILSAGLLAVSLWVVDYGKYMQTGYPLAIQGRYLIQVVPLVLLLGVLAIDQALASRKLKLIFGSVTVICLMWGGGVLTHIVLSKPYWYWQNPVIIRSNQIIRQVAEPITY